MAMDGSSSLRRLVEIDVEKAANHKSLYQLELGMCTDSLLLKAKKKEKRLVSLTRPLVTSKLNANSFYRLWSRK